LLLWTKKNRERRALWFYYDATKSEKEKREREQAENEEERTVRENERKE
jgi:hypothetical protein